VQLIAENAWIETMEKDAVGGWQAYDFSWMLTLDGLQKLAATVSGVGPSLTMLVPSATPRDQLPASLDWVTMAHSLNLQVHPYTFRREREQIPGYATSLEDLINLFITRFHVDGVFTDFPDIAADIVHRPH